MERHGFARGSSFFLGSRCQKRQIVDVPSLLCHVGMAMDSERSTSHRQRCVVRLYTAPKEWLESNCMSKNSIQTLSSDASPRCTGPDTIAFASAASAATIASAIAPHPNNTSQRGSAQAQTAKCCGARRNAQPQNPPKKLDMPRTTRVPIFSSAYISPPFRSYCSTTRTIEPWPSAHKPRTKRAHRSHSVLVARLGQVCCLALCSAQDRATSRVADVAVSTKSKTVRSIPPERRRSPRSSKRCADMVKPTTPNSPLAINSGQVSSESNTYSIRVRSFSCVWLSARTLSTVPTNDLERGA